MGEVERDIIVEALLEARAKFVAQHDSALTLKVRGLWARRIVDIDAIVDKLL